ncbi:phenylpyruvate tautomerase MIF-related protein [Puniceicoccus vermicola]|uniref:Uncharacterized protein n=1 Tax=Puniceicoccus vermicola TaxID=388746 RepID=A0A7X1E745_9BACT|nr:phenylpyruvate tautomerase MIF-related protein [Puniceicoccus vermicola]MBC2603322.1 hypothetical protein [Puniceicoccus vermicola]
MSILHIHSNIPQDETSFAEFSIKVTELLSKTLNRNSSFIQIVYCYSQIALGNQTGPSTLVTLSSPDISREQIKSLTPPLSKMLERLIGSPPPTTYIRFENMDPTKTAWNGRLWQ